MKIIITILAFIVAVQGLTESGLTIRYDIGVGFGKTFFFDIPLVQQKAVAEGWIEKDRYDGAPMESLVMYCYEDCVICAIFDDIAQIAGLQISIPQEDFSGAIYNWTTSGFTNWTTTVNGTTKSLWATNVWFASNETLAKSQEQRLAERAEHNVTLQEGFVCITGFNKEGVCINSNSSDVTSGRTNFTEQACFVWMGHHYFYNMTKTTVCSETTIFPWFLVEYWDEIVAVGIIMPGKMTTKSGMRNWFENPGSTAVKMIVPNGPECLYDLADDPGVVTIHIYFIKYPWAITCLFD